MTVGVAADRADGKYGDGERVTLTATGEASATGWRWFHDDDLLPGETGRALAFDMTSDSQGEYRAAADTATGSTQKSAPVRVTLDSGTSPSPGSEGQSMPGNSATDPKAEPPSHGAKRKSARRRRRQTRDHRRSAPRRVVTAGSTGIGGIRATIACR